MKFLIEADNRKGSGIYKIVNLINRKVYVGSAINLYRRYYHHIGDLRSGNHSNDKLTKAVNKYGLENFSFELLQLCDKDSLLEREQYWIDHYNAIKNGYNIAIKAGNTTGLFGFKVIQKDEAGNIIKIFDSIQECAVFYSVKEKTIVLQSFGLIKNKHNLFIDKDFFPAWLTTGTCKQCKIVFVSQKAKKQKFCSRSCYLKSERPSHSEETRKKISQNNTGLKRSDEAKKKMRAARNLTNYKHSEATKLKIGMAAKGRVASEETRKKMSAISKLKKTMLGKTHSIETRRKMSESAKRRK